MEEIIEHPGYDGDVVNDIAVIRLAQEVKFYYTITSPYIAPPLSKTNSFPKNCLFGPLIASYYIL